MQPMTDQRPTALRGLLSGFSGTLRIVAVMVVVIVVVAIRSQTADQSASPPPVGVAGAVASSASEPSASASAPIRSSDPTVTLSDAPSPNPTSYAAPTPMLEPTPKPTPKPTAKPTPKPTHDPTPEGTPRITTRSGSFGQTLTVQGVTARVARTSAREGALACVTDDPDRQGWTEVVSYELTMTWPDPGDAEEPWFAVGSKPWNVLQFDGPSPFRSGADYIVSTCHRPADSDKVMVEISPPGSLTIYFRWFFD